MPIVNIEIENDQPPVMLTVSSSNLGRLMAFLDEMNEVEKHNTAQAQELERLKIYHANDGASACIKSIGFVHGTVETIDALQKYLNKQAQEILKLKARVNELRGLALKIANTAPIQLSFDGLAHWAHGLLSETPTQSLQAHNAAIEDEVIERCAVAAWRCGMDTFNNGRKYRETREQGAICADAIRNMPRKYPKTN